MRPSEVSDSRVVTLPAPPPPAVEKPRAFPPPPAPSDRRPARPPGNGAPAPSKAAADGTRTAKSVAVPVKPVIPPELVQDSSLFFQKQIGVWTLAQARALLGPPLRQRTVAADVGSGGGRIYAFRDPTSKNKEFELDFDRARGVLRTVYVYPSNVTWQECQRRWGTRFDSLEANKGRTFYTYLDRRLDVLVDPQGRVISFGLY